MTNLILVRHGQTEWNRQNRLQGQRNSPLTKLGREQAAQVKKALFGHSIDKAYVSPLQRARDTLDIILGDRGIDVAVSDNLKEIDLGPWEGKSREDLLKSHPVAYHHFWHRQDLFRLAGAESFHQLKMRVVGELDALFARERGKSVLVVSHGMAIKSAIAHYTGTPLEKMADVPILENGHFLTVRKTNGSVTVDGLRDSDPSPLRNR